MAVSGLVQGKIIDARSKEALEFLTVSLRCQETDTLLKGTVTDEVGSFMLEDLPEGGYVLTVFYVGYKDLNRNIEITSSSPRINLNHLLLDEDSQLLGEVEVVGQEVADALRTGQACFQCRSEHRLHRRFGERRADQYPFGGG